MQTYLRLLKPFRLDIFWTSFLAAISSFCGLLLPTLLSEVTNNGFNKLDYKYVVIMCVAMLVVSTVAMLSMVVATKKAVKVTTGFEAAMKEMVFNKALQLSTEQHNSIGAGALLSRSTHDTETINWILQGLLYGIVTTPILLVGGAMLAFTKDWMLSLVIIAFAPPVVLIMFFLSRAIIPYWRRADSYIDEFNLQITERLSGVRVIRAFNKEDYEHQKTSSAVRVMINFIIKANVRRGLFTPLSQLILNLSTVTVIYIGSLRLQNPQSLLTAGDIVAVVQYIAMFLNSVIMFSFMLSMLPRAKVAATRISEVLDCETPPQAQDLQAEQASGQVTFEDVSFGFEKAERNVLSNLNIKIEVGQKVAFIGGTGSGKTTAANLIAGLLRPVSGKILFGEEDTAQFSEARIRQNVSYVLQRAAIFSGTIRENLQMGNSLAPDEMLINALKAAQIEDFVLGLQDGLDYKLEEAGKNLSGGQKQRLCIARAIIKQAPIYIFDDSFSALDFATEARLSNALKEWLHGKTQIVVTQRAASALNCDKIFVFDDGRIVGEGTHKQLLASCSVYKEIYVSQTGGGNEKE